MKLFGVSLILRWLKINTKLTPYTKLLLSFITLLRTITASKRQRLNMRVRNQIQEADQKKERMAVVIHFLIQVARLPPQQVLQRVYIRPLHSMSLQTSLETQKM